MESFTPWISTAPMSRLPPAKRGNPHGGKAFRFPDDLESTPLMLASLQSAPRVAFDLVMERHGIRPIIAAEVDDMATFRLLARDGDGLVLAPPVVMAGERE